ncbi:hypothetical protein TrRE_jg7625, partial [Triparma retinervis]
REGNSGGAGCEEGEENGHRDTAYLHPRYAVVDELDATFGVLRAVLAMQCWVRVVLAVIETTRVREEVREERAAIMVQCALRCKRARGRVGRERGRWRRVMELVEKRVEEARGTMRREFEDKTRKVEEREREVERLRGIVEELRGVVERVENERDEVEGGKRDMEREVEGILEVKRKEMEE